MRICPKCGMENLDDAKNCFFCDCDFSVTDVFKSVQANNTPKNAPKTPLKKLKPVRNSNSQTAEIPVQNPNPNQNFNGNPNYNSNLNPNQNTYDPNYSYNLYEESPNSFVPPPEPLIDDNSYGGDYDGEEAVEQKSSTVPILITVIALLICAVCILGYMFLIQKKMNENVENNKNQKNSSFSLSIQTTPTTSLTTSITTSVATSTITSITTSSTTSVKTSVTTSITNSVTKPVTSSFTTVVTSKSPVTSTVKTTKSSTVTTAKQTSTKAATSVTKATAAPVTTTTAVSVSVTPCSISGRISANGGVIAGFASSYVVDGGAVKKVRSNLGDGWNVTAVNTCYSKGITWYEIYDSDDNDYYGWVDASYIDFSPPKTSVTVTSCNMSGRIASYGGSVSGYASSYVVDGGSPATVRGNLGNGWNVTAVNTCYSNGITWYELYDSDDGDYYGWVDAGYIDFSAPSTPTPVPSSSVTVTSCSISGKINTYGGTVASFASSYVVDGGSPATVRASLGDWNVTAVNTCVSMGITWYELYDSDDGDYYGWVDSSYISF